MTVNSKRIISVFEYLNWYKSTRYVCVYLWIPIKICISDVLFPSMTVLAGSNASLECNIYVNNSWDKVTLHQNTVNGSLLVAVYSSNGTRSFPGGSNFLNVAFDTPSDGIRVLLNISLRAASSCPSLLQFTCGITMADTLKSSFTNTSSLSITGKPVFLFTFNFLQLSM